MRNLKLLLAGIVAGLCLVVAASAEEAAQAKPQTMCPVMNEAINKSLYVDFEGKRLYVCCKGCVSTVKKDPAKYIKKMEAEGITLAKTPAAETPAPAPAK
jgi:YHS domain-containing protein